jgi:hypothetical protein
MKDSFEVNVHWRTTPSGQCRCPSNLLLRGEASRLLRFLHHPAGASAMATSSITGADRVPTQPKGRDVEALGPSDSSDSGSDVQGELDLASPIDLDSPVYGTVQPGLDSDSDSGGSGERGAALPDEDAREGSDILPDRVIPAANAGPDEDDIEAELDVAELADMADRVSSDMAAEDEEEEDDEEADESRRADQGRS